MVYCASKLIENLKLFYKSNFSPRDLQAFGYCSPKISSGLSRRQTHSKCGLLLKKPSFWFGNTVVEPR